MYGARPLAEQIPTLATVLKGGGYATAAFANGAFLDPKFGLARDFDLYDYFSDVQQNRFNESSRYGRSAAATNEAILKWLDGRARAPFFIFAHYFDVHSDWNELSYDSPKEYREMFCGDHEGRRFVGNSRFLLKVNQDGIRLDADATKYIRALYQAGVRYTDDRFGELVAQLKQRGLFENSLIVLVSDHGEEFMEAGHRTGRADSRHGLPGGSLAGVFRSCPSSPACADRALQGAGSQTKMGISRVVRLRYSA